MIIIQLTLAQARAVSLALSNSLGTPEDAIAILQHPQTVEAARRAHNVINRAAYTQRRETKADRERAAPLQRALKMNTKSGGEK